MMDFYERYSKCCKEKGIAPASQYAADQIGCTKANISLLAKNHTTPKGDIVARAAKMLDVSADYLLGLSDTPVPIGGNMTEKEAAALSMLRDLNDDGQEAAVAMLSGLSYQDIYKKHRSDEQLAEKT